MCKKKREQIFITLHHDTHNKQIIPRRFLRTASPVWAWLSVRSSGRLLTTTMRRRRTERGLASQVTV